MSGSVPSVTDASVAVAAQAAAASGIPSRKEQLHLNKYLLNLIFLARDQQVR